MSMQGGRVKRKLSLSHATAYARLTLEFSLSSTIFQINPSLTSSTNVWSEEVFLWISEL